MRHTYNSNQLYKYKDMEKASIRIKKHHWLIAMLLLFGGNNPTAVGQAAMLSSQTHAGVGITMKNSGSLWIRLEAFDNPQKLVRNLKDHRVELDQSLRTILERWTQTDVIGPTWISPDMTADQTGENERVQHQILIETQAFFAPFTDSSILLFICTECKQTWK